MNIKPVHQTLFGTNNGPNDNIGNCFPACIASILHMPLKEVPHFYQLYQGNSSEDIWWKIVEWLQIRDISIIAWDWDGFSKNIRRIYKGSVCILTGKSPRFPDNYHAVVGYIDDQLNHHIIHDPHPDGTGFIGEPTMVEFLFNLPIMDVPK